ncbi:NAD-dependent epimerase/dehydratase family protein [Selenihalanaerobacter shriftii]|uniref:Nucleoside-diphosphate-sugar epimerase n=1 Tax=Selenihalanaerobacter shriftii TaxID=142842 RepID=A0A1T4QYD4_9FIRM|nr:NAD-dependent epimerase/dehydratase family protein [Selenihalanaerobacter shriftii]SKA08812.1 Nucleoside-diphosphate-sugar epimerase [Selenihalanaerobacter shriftii]
MGEYKEFFKDKRVLITGSNGFIGRHAVERFKNYNCKTYGLGVEKENQNKEIKYFQCDVTDYTGLSNILEEINPDYILHLAAVVSAVRDYSLFPKMLDIHAKSLYNFYEILKNNDTLKLLINFGSTEEYGNYNGKQFKENFFEKSLSPYAASKTAGVHFAYMIGKNETFPVISIRPSVLYGKYQSDNKFISYIINNLIKNKSLNLTPCKQTRDFIWVERFLNILTELIISKQYCYGEIYNISSGESKELKYLVEYAKELLNSNSEVNYGALEYRENEIMEFNVSNDKINSILDKNIKCNFEKDFSKFLKGYL